VDLTTVHAEYDVLDMLVLGPPSHPGQRDTQPAKIAGGTSVRRVVISTT
jgi:hypothetical protein